MDLLRAFATVTEAGGFSRAGEILGRSQPAVSLQIKRLEDLVQAQLLRRKGKTVELTDAGETLARYAYQILCLNDEAFAKLVGGAIAGPVRVGLPNDFVVSFMPEVLGGFAKQHGDASLDVECALSADLLRGLREERYDVVIALCDDAPDSRIAKGWTERVCWVTGNGSPAHFQRPVPLVVYPAGCLYRARMTRTLDRYNTAWRTVFSSASLAGLISAVSAGLGVTALSEKTVPPDLRALSDEESGLPLLADVDVGVFLNRSRLSEAGQAFVNHMIAHLDDAYA